MYGFAPFPSEVSEANARVFKPGEALLFDTNSC